MRRMGRREKLLQTMRGNPTSVRYDEIENLLCQAGCQVTRRGSHRTFRHHAVKGYLLTIVDQYPMKAPYVRAALKLYEEIEEAMGDDSPEQR